MTMASSPKKGSESFAEVTVIDSQYNHFRDYVDIIRVYKCKLCPFCSPLEHVITSHMSEVHFPRRCFLCKQCLFVFESREQLIEHVEAGHGTQSLNCSFGEPVLHDSPALPTRLGSSYTGEEKSGKKDLDDGGVNGQSVTSSTSNLANIPDDPPSKQANSKDNDLPTSPGCLTEARGPAAESSSPVSQTYLNWCTSSSSQIRQHEKANQGQLMGLGVRKMLQRRHSLGGSHPASELRMGFFSKAVKTEPVSPKDSKTVSNHEKAKSIIKDVASADSLTSDSNESGQRESMSRSSMTSCPDTLRSKECEVIKAIPVQRDVAVVRGVPVRTETAENFDVKHEKLKPRENKEVQEEKSKNTPGESQQDSRLSPILPFNDTYSKTQAIANAVSTLDLGSHPRNSLPTSPKGDLRTESKVYQRDRPPTSLRDIVSHVMEKHRHNSDVIQRPADIPLQHSVEFSRQLSTEVVEFHGPVKPRPRSYSITEGEISSFHERKEDAFERSKDELQSNLHNSTENKQFGDRVTVALPGSVPLWFPYHQQNHERNQAKHSRIVSWPYHGDFPNSQIPSKVSAPQSNEDSALYHYLRNPPPHMKRRRNSIGVMNPVETNRGGLPWPPHLPQNEMVARFGPGSQPHMPWGTTGFLHGYGLPQMNEKSHSPNMVSKHGAQVSPNRYGEYLAEMERKEGNQSNTSDQTSSEGTQDLAQVDDITRQVNSAIQGTGGFYTEQNGALDDGGHDFDCEDDENRSDDGRKRSRKSTFNIYREIPERKRKLDRVEEEKIKKSYNADGSFDYFTLTGWKAYKCDLCKKRRFKTASELEDHKRLKHASDLNQKSRKLVFHSVHVDENEFEESI